MLLKDDPTDAIVTAYVALYDENYKYCQQYLQKIVANFDLVFDEGNRLFFELLIQRCQSEEREGCQAVTNKALEKGLITK